MSSVEASLDVSSLWVVSSEGVKEVTEARDA